MKMALQNAKGINWLMKKASFFLWIYILASLTLFGCSDNHHGLSQDNPTAITIWHYYSGHVATQFDELVTEFNNTVGRENGIIVTAQSMSSANDLEQDRKSVV